MLRVHMQNCENQLLSQYQIPAITGHTLHKGNPREVFVREFLEHHLPSLVDIGTGEIIDCKSVPNEPRNQHDIVVYHRTYPKLHFGGDTLGFLVESVSATIEVKSVINEAQIRQAVNAAYRVKHLEKSTCSGITIGSVENSIFSGVVAYSGPEHMATVSSWIQKCEQELGIVDSASAQRSVLGKGVLTPSIDAVLLLGKGISYNSKHVILQVENIHDKMWVNVESRCDNLLLFFLLMLRTVATIRMSGLNPGAYVKDIACDHISLT